MNKTIHFLLAFVLFCGLTPLSAQIPHLVFHAELGGDEMIPAVNTQGKALVTFLFTPDRKNVDVSGMLVRLDGTVTSAKIRKGKTGQTGSVIFDLLPYINDRHIIGQVPVPDTLLHHLLTNSVYVEVATTAHPNGEIRGQFTCEVDLDFKSFLSGDQAVPPNASNALAYGGFHYPLGSRDLVYAFTYRGLSSAITSADLYEGLPGQTGNPPIHLPGTIGGLIQGLIALDTIDPEFLRKAVENRYYVVVKTVNYPQGEIIGQLIHVGFFGSLAPINGIQQIPPPIPPTPGFGFSSTTPSGDLDSMTTWVFINNLAPSSVKIHIGDPGQNGPEFLEFGASPIPGWYVKSYPVTEQQLTDFAQGRFYIQVKTAANPDGAIRGVMKNTLRKAYAFDLCGIQMVPPTTSDALGVAVASVDQANCYLNYKMIADGLASDPVDSYF
ncbi:MAG: CHRD domain-containing protein, partial [Saprospiraceae bacterium]|nr:CHRD domain-containing protein [Saprospiraceae bacterium]